MKHTQFEDQSRTSRKYSHNVAAVAGDVAKRTKGGRVALSKTKRSQVPANNDALPHPGIDRSIINS